MSPLIDGSGGLLGYILALGPLGVVVWLISRLFSSRRLKRVLLPPKPINELSGETSAIEGRAVPIVELASAFSRRPCVAYLETVLVDEAHRTTETAADALQRLSGLESWQTASCRVEGAFLLEDDSGQALVWPAGSSFVVSGQQAWSSFDGLDAPAEPLRVESERLIAAGQTVYVLGRARTYPELMARLKEDCTGMPPELLQALMQRQDLHGLPCFFSDGEPFVVADRPFSELSA